MLSTAQVVAAVLAEATLVADHAEKNESTWEEEPEDQGVKECVEDESRPDRQIGNATQFVCTPKTRR